MRKKTLLPALDDPQARLLRIGAQQLAVRRPGSGDAVVEVVRALGAVQTQESAAAGLALRARCRGLTRADLEEVRCRKRSIVRM